MTQAVRTAVVIEVLVEVVDEVVMRIVQRAGLGPDVRGREVDPVSEAGEAGAGNEDGVCCACAANRRDGFLHRGRPDGHVEIVRFVHQLEDQARVRREVGCQFRPQVDEVGVAYVVGWSWVG